MSSASLRSRRRPPRSRASAAADPPPAGWRPHRRRAGSARRGRHDGDFASVSFTATGTTIVNCAPPSGAVLGPDPALLDRPAAPGRSRGPCPCPTPALSRQRRGRTVRTDAAGRPGRSRAVDREPRRPIPRPDHARSTSIVDPAAILRGVLQQVRQRGRGQPRIEPHRHVVARSSTVTWCPASVCSTWSRAAATISDGWVHRDSVATAPASMRAISRMFWNSRVSRSTSVRMRSLCSARPRREPGRHDVAGGDADGGQRRAQIVPERRQQRGLQLFALPGQLAGLALLEKLRALDRDRHDAGQGVERAGLDRTAGGGEGSRSASCRPAAAPAGSSARRPSSSDVRHRSGHGVELERGLRGGEARSTARAVQIDVRAPASNTSHSRTGQRDGDEVQVEAAGDRPRQHDSASRLSVIISTSRLRSNSRASSSRRPTASCGPRAARRPTDCSRPG